MRFIESRATRGVVGAILAGVVFSVYPGSEALRHELFDQLVRLTRQVPPEYESPVVVVGLDDAAMKLFETRRGAGLDRAAFARLVDAISACHPRVLAVDIVFRERHDRVTDALLGRSLGAAPGSVVAEALRYEEGRADPILLEPIPEIVAAGVTAGITNVTPDGDGTVRRIALLFQNRGNDIPHLAVEAARRYLGCTSIRRVPGGLALTGGPARTGRELPTDPTRQTMVIPYRGPDRFPIISAGRFLAPGGPDPDLTRHLADKLVLLGAAGSAKGDLHTTPYGEGAGRMGLSPGVLLLAHVSEGIIAGDLLAPQSQLSSAFLLAGALAAGAFAFPLLGPVSGLMVLVLLLCILGLAGVAAFESGVLLATVRVGEALVLEYAAVLLVSAHARREETGETRFLADPGAPSTRRCRITPSSEVAPAPLLACILTASDAPGAAACGDWRGQVGRLDRQLKAIEVLAAAGAWVEPQGPRRAAAYAGPGEQARALAPALLEVVCRLLLDSDNASGVRLYAGLHLGPAVIGYVGGERRAWLTTTGEAPWLAARLSDLAIEYGVPVLVTDTVMQSGASPALAFREIDRVHGPGGVIAIHAPMPAASASADPLRQSLADYAAGLAGYYAMDWASARAHLFRVLDRVPGDGPARTLLARIDAFKVEPPRAGWAGARDLD